MDVWRVIAGGIVTVSAVGKTQQRGPRGAPEAADFLCQSDSFFLKRDKNFSLHR